MKTHLALLFTIVSINAFGIVRTVSNNPTAPAQFTTFDAAQTASAAGDTIYIYGSPFDYTSITIRKRLVIIGAGYSPNNQFGQPTSLGGIVLFRDSGTNNASGSVIMGVLNKGGVDFGGTLVSNNITIFRNRFIGFINLSGLSAYADGWVIYNNIIDSYIYGGAGSRTSQSATNIIIANNIFTQNGFLYLMNSNSILVDHNLFLGTATKFNTVFNVIISNNVFARTSGTHMTYTVLCTFNNNITNQSTIGSASEYNPTNSFTATYISTGGGANSGGGNFVGVDPLFTTATMSTIDTYNPNFNYRLQASSPGKNAGTDGTDLGIYGGSYPFPTGGPGTQYDTSPMPPIPQVTAVNIQNSTIQPNGTLNVQVQGKVNN